MIRRRLLQVVVLGVATCLFLLTFLHIAQVQNSEKNPKISGDQIAFLNFAKEAYHSNFHFTGGRNQMPLYPWIQALFYSPELTDEAFLSKRSGSMLHFQL